MTKSQLAALIASTREFEEFEDFAAQAGRGLSESGTTDNLMPALVTIWQFREGPDFRKILTLSELSQAEFSRHYEISIRTVEDWFANKIKPK